MAMILIGILLYGKSVQVVNHEYILIPDIVGFNVSC